MRRRWFCVGAWSAAAGREACLPAATSPAIGQARPPRTVPRSSMAPGEALRPGGIVGNPVPDAARLCACRLFTGGAIESLDKDEPVTWLHEELCRNDHPVRWSLWPPSQRARARSISSSPETHRQQVSGGLGGLAASPPPPAVPSPLQKTPHDTSLCP
jgi:hypothetical protein